MLFAQLKKIRVVIISGNSRGLQNDSLVLQRAFKRSSSQLTVELLWKSDALGLKVYWGIRYLMRRLLGFPSLFIHLENLQSSVLWLATENYLIPNQDWFRSETEAYLSKTSNVALLCKTYDAVRIFSDLSLPRFYIGFSSKDRYLAHIKKDFNRFLHLAGQSDRKGTAALIQVWKSHPNWPPLTLKTTVQNHIAQAKGVANIHLITEELSERELSQLMNLHGVHLCLSEAEGFGHYIGEALSMGAIVITTDAPPMNELVTQECGFLVNAYPKGKQYRATKYQFDRHELEQMIDKLLHSNNDESLVLSKKSRQRFHYLTSQFENNIHHCLNENIL